MILRELLLEILRLLRNVLFNSLVERLFLDLLLLGAEEGTLKTRKMKLQFFDHEKHARDYRSNFFNQAGRESVI